jgi:hypothetical protein
VIIMRELHDLAFYSTVALWGCVIAWCLGAAVWFIAKTTGAL